MTIPAKNVSQRDKGKGKRMSGRKKNSGFDQTRSVHYRTRFGIITVGWTPELAEDQPERIQRYKIYAEADAGREHPHFRR